SGPFLPCLGCVELSIHRPAKHLNIRQSLVPSGLGKTNRAWARLPGRFLPQTPANACVVKIPGIF
ncbi:MAG: hypothetical protein Q8R56_16005, partial [Polaromonas sp.]|nr:hypothetical protein [Polaromonas sp.]